MSETVQPIHSTEAEARAVAEAARETEWQAASVLKEIFLGKFRFDLIHPFPGVGEAPREEFVTFLNKIKTVLANHCDPATIDETGEYPPELIKGLAEIGAFGMKIPKKYGGLGMNQVEYSAIMELLGAHEPNVSALLSAHQSIGVPQPLYMFGTEAQKEKYLTRCAKGAISAFALTEPHVGSDPSSLSTTAELSADGESYILNGVKLWCTNGTLAEIIVVMARNPETKKISAFIVETDWEGVKIENRCRFMGLKAIGNAVFRFTNVRVPKENIIGKEGRGLKIALMTLNTGRLSLPASAVGATRRCLEICRKWCEERVQWGVQIGKHEAITHMLADMATTTFAMESISNLASELAMRKGYDIRLEAAAAKEWNSVQGWRMVDTTMQIRGGRGYETERSLEARGEKPIGVERMMRDSRINMIFEGSSEVMHLFMAREAVDKHLSVAGDIIDPKKSTGQKLAALPKIAAFYAWWYPSRWIGWGLWPRYAGYGKLGKHLRFIDRNTRRLSRQVFHGMLRHGPALERKQGFLFRLVDIGLELFAMAASVSRAHTLKEKGDPEAAQAIKLADGFCQNSRKKVKQLFKSLWFTNDAAQYALGIDVLKGQHEWMETALLEAPEAAEVASGEKDASQTEAA